MKMTDTGNETAAATDDQNVDGISSGPADSVCLALRSIISYIWSKNSIVGNYRRRE